MSRRVFLQSTSQETNFDPLPNIFHMFFFAFKLFHGQIVCRHKTVILHYKSWNRLKIVRFYPNGFVFFVDNDNDVLVKRRFVWTSHSSVVQFVIGVMFVRFLLIFCRNLRRRRRRTIEKFLLKKKKKFFVVFQFLKQISPPPPYLCICSLYIL